jgi:3'-5' exonuclease
MVRAGARFLIDASFIADKIHNTFLGAPLLTVTGRDRTFAFGFLRDLLRLRHALEIHAGLVVLGREAHLLSSQDSIQSLIPYLHNLRIPHIYEPLNRTLDLMHSIRSSFNHIVASDASFLQFSGDSLTVILPGRGADSEWDWISAGTVKEMMGISPAHIPTYLALTDSSSIAGLTNREAVHLIGAFGDLDSIYRNLDRIGSVHTRTKLAQHQATIRYVYVQKKSRCVRRFAVRSFFRDSFDDLDTAANRRQLKQCGFASISTLLSLLSRHQSRLQRSVPDQTSYRAVLDRAGLHQLLSLVRASKLCAIDVEADSKDPRTANLLGIAFCVKAGEALLVPLTEVHLKGLTTNDALGFIKQILSSKVAFIGHNIKYDSLLLQRAGAPIGEIHFDTMLAAYECHGDWPFFNLSFVCERVLGRRIKSYADVVDGKVTFLDLPLTEIVNHACQDADFAFRLYPVLSRRLEELGIRQQFLDDTMRDLQRLGMLEFRGIAVDLHKIGRIRKRLLRRAEDLKLSICSIVGREVDVGSQDDLMAVVRETAGLRACIGTRRVTISTLEQLAAREPLARYIVYLKRLRSRIGRLETVYANVRNGRVYPLFNQISSRVGVITGRPNVFGTDGLPELKASFDCKASDLFADSRKSLQTLAQVAGEPLLQKADTKRTKRLANNKKLPLISVADQAELLLRLAIGQSDSKLARRFMVERLSIAEMRHDLEGRYRKVFRWLNRFRSETLGNGYATKGKLTKHIDGLKSSDVARRQQAAEYTVRWLIHY